MSDLKPCPFCGSKDISEDWGETYHLADGMHQTGYLECKCGVTLEHDVNEFNMDWTLGSAILKQKWNNRPNVK